MSIWKLPATDPEPLVGSKVEKGKKEKKRNEIWVFERELDYYTIIQYEFVGLWENAWEREQRERKREREKLELLFV